MTVAESEATLVQRRTVGVLVASQALGGIGVFTGITVATLLAEDILGDASFAGMTQTAQLVGAAVVAFLLSQVMAIRGRRVGLALGYGLGALGAGLCIVGGAVGSFAVLLLGTFALGSAVATNSQARYAATDLASPRRRARALSVVVWATTIGAVVGPNLVGPAGDVAEAVGLPALTGPFLFSLVGLFAGAGVLWTWLRPDPLLTARRLADGSGGGPSPRVSLRRVWSVVRTRPRAMAAMAAIAVSHSVMLTVMVMTPIHMSHGGADLEVIGFVISVHIVGMFAFSPLIGWLADLLGPSVVLAAGALVLLLAVALAGSAPAGHSAVLAVGLFLLGLGWSCGVVAASSLLVDAVPLIERPGVQGVADLLQGVCAAIAASLGGVVLASWGYSALNGMAGVLAVVVLGSAVVARARA
ncbi:MAG: MFS transporter [Propionibacteriales bacterium]|nr:MFS transporter [Propionibacteriales bacterium]